MCVRSVYLSLVPPGGSIHWERVGSSEKGLDSVEVEMTSYVLLALLSSPPIEGFGLDYASSIIRWLAQQQNPYGGFSSTQVPTCGNLVTSALM